MRQAATRAVIGAIIAGGGATTASAGGPARVEAPVHVRSPVSDTRLDPAVGARGPAARRIRLDDPHGRLRSGFGGTLVNLLPFEASRFHLSAGSRLFGRPQATPALQERLTPSSVRPGGGTRFGGRRFAPAVLMGVDGEARGVVLGVDAGVVMGAAVERGMRGPRGFRRGGGVRGPNGVARVTVGFRF